MSGAYIAFDLYPSAKGAATHISHMLDAMFDHVDKGYLYCLGNEKLPTFQEEGDHEIHRFNDVIENYLKRAEGFSDFVTKELKESQPDLTHFRDIWSGLGAVAGAPESKKVFEVNSFTSIELPYRYSMIPKETLDKIAGLEDYCLQKSDAIITPSRVTAKAIVDRGVSESKVEVISNGADLPQRYDKPSEAPEKYILYFGALQSWQGIDVLLKAMRSLRDYEDLHLVICSSNRNKFAKSLKKFATKLEVENIVWNAQLSKEELNSWIQHSLLTVAPLTFCSRNVQQGCSPLKIIESLSNQTAVVASDLPVVREIVNEQTAKLVRPDRPAELARAIRFLLDYPKQRELIARNGYEVVSKQYLWSDRKQQVKDLYTKILNN